ncbi:GntR family transcriptional regulator [Leisingera sp. S232]|uniref:GntR family transcriptional regulator n=1 Tax=Leisingera sp. S232 TaxID=3415132 RepID=UPI000A4852F3
MTETTSPPAAGQESPAKLPAHEIVYQKLRAQILFGELVPGQAVTIQGLVETLGAGMTPVREAIRRLISDGALIFQGNRRVSVPLLGPQDLEELIFARQTIECELARRATSQIGVAGIEELASIDSALDKAIATGDVAGYLVQNYSFHTVLYSHAGAPILSDIADRLWLRFGPSLRVVSGRLGTQSFPDRHKDILDALRKKDPEMAALAMERDVCQGMEHVVEGVRDAN